MRAVVLLSGGLDSATTLAWAVREGYQCHALTVRYGQRHAVEIERAAELASALGAASQRVVAVDLRAIGGSALTDEAVPLPGVRTAEEIGAAGIPATYVPARNTVFLALALGLAERLGALDLFVGVNAVDYSGYPDCRPEFLEAFERLAAVATRQGVEGGRFRLHAPLLRLGKGEIVRLAVALGVDVGRTVSCYAPDAEGRGCGRCDACVLRAKGFREAGLADPALPLSAPRG
ncbi:MAG TPA: 7-cyano-7-deazaguanine synthase QueC [Candidatus Polarisedimenticolaceae bacterium]|nr:7-cyano-7-deazaguanine synthase QueC [Candidatus Polarisedimenticolaceae bacterium]